MAEVIVYNAAGEPVQCSTLADVGEVSWTTGLGNGKPGGCQEAQWQMNLPDYYTDPLFTPGRLVEVWDGPVCVYCGVMLEPERGYPWTLHARGLSDLARDYPALDGDGLPTSVPRTAVEVAIAAGLPWRLSSDLAAALPVTAYSANEVTEKQNTVADLLDAYAASQGLSWGVWADRELVLTAGDTTPSWLLRGGQMMSVAGDDYTTRVVARYVSAEGPQVVSSVTVENTEDRDRWGGKTRTLDLTKLGLMTSGRAADLTQAVLDAAGQRTGFTEPFVATRSTLTSLGGIPARLEQVQAGQMVRVLDTLDPTGNWGGGAVDLVIAEAPIIAGAEAINLSPPGMAGRSLDDLFAAPEPPTVDAFAEVA